MTLQGAPYTGRVAGEDDRDPDALLDPELIEPQPDAQGYEPEDAERFLPERHESRRRTAYARDRARLLHSSALRRLAAKTQVLSPASGVDFARNRLTHSLEVAQIGREIATNLRLDPDIVDTACLAHDLGHPPFGHNGEKALDVWADDIGGFEGNAQTLRIVTRLEPKVIAPDGRPLGLNLTRACLDASTKYPWTREEGRARGTRKFGCYADDAELFAWLRRGAPEGRTPVEAQVMDLSDDIAYSVHDLEDAIMEGFIPVEELADPANRQAIVYTAHDWSGGSYSEDELGAAFARLRALPVWIDSADDDPRRAQARLKNLTSQLIGRFARAATAATEERFGAEHGGFGPEGETTAPLARYRAEVVVPREIAAEIALLKGLVAGFIMSLDSRQPIYARQRELLVELADALWESGDEHLDGALRLDFAAAEDDAARKRVIVDQVASLTDPAAIAWHARLCEGGSRLDGALM